MASEKSVLALIRAARPTFRNQNDKIAFAIHSSFLISGYVLTATGPQALSDNALSDPSNDEVPIDGWNELNNEYAFVYANPERGSEKVLVKCLPMNDKLLVHALSQGSSEPLSLEINVGDYAGSGEEGGSNYSQHFKNLDKLVKKIDGDILSKLDSSSKTSSSSRRMADSRDDSRRTRGRSVTKLPSVIIGRIAKERTHVQFDPCSGKASGAAAEGYTQQVLTQMRAEMQTELEARMVARMESRMVARIEARMEARMDRLCQELEARMEAQIASLSQQHTPVAEDLFRVSSKGSCNATELSRDPLHTSVHPHMCELFVEGDPPLLVAIGRSFEGGTIIHGVPLQPDWTRVTVDHVVVADASVPVPVPTQDVHLVGDACGTFLAWPKRLVMPPSVATKEVIRRGKQVAKEPDAGEPQP